MKTVILNKLNAIAESQHLKILFACESGSRGWQFPSLDSDYDVRFIYLRPLHFYLSVEDRTDHLGFPIHDELDLYGWDLRKVLQLLRKSNTTPFEWLQSPIVYQETGNFREELWNLCPEFFNARVNVHHYLGIAKGALDTVVNENEIRIKKLCYVLRSLLSAKWCLERNQIAPMEIGPLAGLLPTHLQAVVKELIALKATGTEGMMVKIDPLLKHYIEKEFISCSESSNYLPKPQFEVASLNSFFFKILQDYDN